MKRALVVLSGGQDSTTCLFLAKQHCDEVHAVTFDYGQRHEREIMAAMEVAKRAGVQSHEVIRIGPVLVGKSFLTDLSAPVETFDSTHDMDDKNAFKENKLDSSFVPMRNQLFLTIAMNRARVLGCERIYTGVTAADFVEFGGISWDWLGGFVDAEGCFTEVDTASSPNIRLSISQKDRECLERIGIWVEKQVGAPYSIHTAKRGCSEIYFGVQALRLMAQFLLPHIHSNVRRKQFAKHARNIKIVAESAMSDAYIAGFWEGDGSYDARWVKQRHAREVGGDAVTRSAVIVFWQKDPGFLNRIKEYLGAGSIGKDGDNWSLKVSDGPKGQRLLSRLRKHFNVLGSFQKITKGLHRVGLNAGGFNPPYPDCTPDFIWSFEEASNQALLEPGLQRIAVEAPLMYLSKAAGVLLAHSIPGCWDAMAYTHTAYDGKYPPVGKDHASLLRAKGFEEAGLPDPLVLRACSEGLMELPTTNNYAGVL